MVNISTTQTVRRARRAPPQVPGRRTIRSTSSSAASARPARAEPGPRPRRLRTRSRSLGSGFIISTDGYILTNAHVVDGADEVTVTLTDKREFKAKVIGADKRTDVALLKIDAHRPADGDASATRTSCKVGEWVVAIGSPFGFENTVTAGIVSAKGRALPQENFVPFIQTDVAVNPGNSGGPLFNMRGEVVGINSQIYSRTGGYMGLSFAIPIDVAIDVAEAAAATTAGSRAAASACVIQEVTQGARRVVRPRPSRAARWSTRSRRAARPRRPASRPATSSSSSTASRSTRSSDLPRIVGATSPGTQGDAAGLAQGRARRTST